MLYNHALCCALLIVLYGLFLIADGRVELISRRGIMLLRCIISTYFFVMQAESIFDEMPIIIDQRTVSYICWRRAVGFHQHRL